MLIFVTASRQMLISFSSAFHLISHLLKQTWSRANFLRYVLILSTTLLSCQCCYCNGLVIITNFSYTHKINSTCMLFKIEFRPGPLLCTDEGWRYINIFVMHDDVQIIDWNIPIKITRQFYISFCKPLLAISLYSSGPDSNLQLVLVRRYERKLLSFSTGQGDLQ